MAANGTPQSYLYNQRPTNTMRDRSMEQNNTNSGNPYGYVPQYSQQNPNLGRYMPPQVQGGPWTAQGFGEGPYNYNLPGSYGMGTMPSGAAFVPQYMPPPGLGNNGSPNPYYSQIQNTGSLFIPQSNPQAQQSSMGQSQQQLASAMAAYNPGQLDNAYYPQFSGGVGTGSSMAPQPAAPNNGVEINGTLPSATYNPAPMSYTPPRPVDVMNGNFVANRGRPLPNRYSPMWRTK